MTGQHRDLTGRRAAIELTGQLLRLAVMLAVVAALTVILLVALYVAVTV